MSTDAAWRTPLAFALWLLVFACAESSTAPHERAPKATDPSLYQAPDSRATPDHMTEYSWHLGTTGTEMGSTSGRACFLTRVTGDFRRDRFVRIRISNGSWVLGGSRVVTAADVGVVNASARCSRVYSYTDEYYWNELQNAKVMGSINGRACFLTGVGGGMARTDDRVEVYSGNSTSWWLGGTSNSQYDAGVHGRARCIIYPPIGPQQPYTYTGWVNANSEKILQPTSWKCYLAGIRGVFEGSRSVAIIFADKDFWRLTMTKHETAAASAKVGCTQ
jgi:hypothetical protein